MSSVKCHTQIDVKLHWAQCVKNNYLYNQMQPFPIPPVGGQILATRFGFVICIYICYIILVCSILRKSDNYNLQHKALLTHSGQVTHICIGNLTIIGSDKGLASGRCQAIIWTNAGILLIGHSGTNFNEIFSEIVIFSLKKICLNVLSMKWRPFFLSLNVLNYCEEGDRPTTKKPTVWQPPHLF